MIECEHFSRCGYLNHNSNAFCKAFANQLICANNLNQIQNPLFWISIEFFLATLHLWRNENFPIDQPFLPYATESEREGEEKNKSEEKKKHFTQSLQRAQLT